MAQLTDGYLIKVSGDPVSDEQYMEDAGEIVTEVGATGSDAKFPTEQAVREAITASAATKIGASGVTYENMAANGDVGTSAGTVCAGNDSRLSDARTPTAHAASHASAGSDAVKLDDLAAPDDNTDLDATTSAHGLLPKLGGGSTNFLRADGTWAEPPGAGGGVWGGITGTLSDQTDLQSALDGKKATFSENTAFNKNFGTGSGDVCQGNDSRLSDARTPTAHASSHASGQADAIKLDDLAATDDNTDLNASTGAHGLLPKLSGTATEFLAGDGSWATPAGAGAAAVWETIYTDETGLTPTDANTLPYTGTGVEVGMGVRCTYDDGGGNDYYYGIVSAVSDSTSFDTHLSIFNASYAVTKIEVCNASALTEILLHAPGLYAGAAHDDLFTDWGTPIAAGKAFAVGRVYAKHGTDDSAASTSEPAININIGGTSNNIFASDIAMTTSFADAAASPSFTHYTAAAGEIIDVKVAQATGGTPGHDASNLSVLIVGVPL